MDRYSFLRRFLILAATLIGLAHTITSATAAEPNFATDRDEIVERLLEQRPSTPGIRAKGLSAPKPLNGVNLRIRFESNSASLQQTSLGLLDSLAEALSDPRIVNSQVAIAGHTDDTGSEIYNLALSRKRAESVSTYLVETHGLSADRFVILGFGESVPLNDNATPIQRKVNRRVETALLP